MELRQGPGCGQPSHEESPKQMKHLTPSVGVVMVVQNDEETIERSVLSFYDHVRAIAVSTDPHRGWSGKRVVADDTVVRLLALDKDDKITIIQRNFCLFREPLRNETYQRQYSADLLARQQPGLQWICQIDADEEFLSFPAVIRYLTALPRRTRCVRWNWIQLFRALDGDRYLAVVGGDGQPVLARFYLAHRPHARLVSCRFPTLLPVPLSRSGLRLNELARRSNRFLGLMRPFDREPLPADTAALHFTFAKSERRVLEKLATWGHAFDFDVDAFIELWRDSPTTWPTIRNFHPTVPVTWPALRPVELSQLRNDP